MPVYEVARLDELTSGRGRVVRAGGRELALFRLDDRVYALDNQCVHNGGPLGEGDAERGYAVCPWHGWRYDLETGESPLNPLVRIGTYETWVDGGRVLVRVD